ncbi:hypothetical protein DEO72_LG4g200 [Vigna unguiculata]|uniref:Uncharacterized protein n=1 Tax=Vigna unguiculata TaxID=3917 RepID=A0A4D6LLX7_VIGUN|nr:hypothetical protein DEO72_LG4g200 [Vigna unguiculata]
MNLPAHIITCSPPSMNLPAHGTTSLDPSITSLRKSNTRKPLIAALSLGAAYTPPGETWSIAWRSTPCRQAQPVAESTSDSLPPDDHTRAARRYTSSETSLVLAPKVDNPALSKIPPKNSFALLGGNSLSARGFMTLPSNWVTIDASPGGIIMPARRFLGGKPETYENDVELGKLSYNYTWQSTFIHAQRRRRREEGEEEEKEGEREEEGEEKREKKKKKRGRRRRRRGRRRR